MRKKTVLFLLAALGVAASAQAQWNYVVDVVRGDSTALIQLVKNNTKIKSEQYTTGDTLDWLQNGDVVSIAAADSGLLDYHGFYVTVTVDGKKYLVNSDDLVYGDNPVDRTDWVNRRKNSQRLHTDMGHFYVGSAKPYWMMFVLLAAALLLAIVGRRAMLVLSGLLLVAATAIEVYGFYLFQTDMLWWLDKDIFGFWWRMLHMLLFALAIYMQLKTMLVIREKSDAEAVSMMAPGGLMIVAVVIVVLVTIVLSLFKVNDSTINTISYVVAAVMAFIGVLVSASSNRKHLNGFERLCFALFALLWGTGLIVSTVLLVVSIFKLILAVVVVALVVMAALGAEKTSGTVKWKDSKGKLHNTKQEAIDANEHYANRSFIGDMFDY